MHPVKCTHAYVFKLYNNVQLVGQEYESNLFAVRRLQNCPGIQTRLLALHPSCHVIWFLLQSLEGCEELHMLLMASFKEVMPTTCRRYAWMDSSLVAAQGPAPSAKPSPCVRVCKRFAQIGKPCWKLGQAQQLESGICNCVAILYTDSEKFAKTYTNDFEKPR